VKSAVVISSTTSYSTQSLKPRPKPTSSSPWSSPSPSPPASDDCSEPNQRSPYPRSLYQDQDSGYDGFCPEKSIYSTGSSETSSVLSSDSPDTSYREDSYGRSPARPRPSAIYEKHSEYCSDLREPPSSGYRDIREPPLSTGQARNRATISQATVVTLSKTGRGDATPPPLPPRPPPLRDPSSTPVPPAPQPKPRSRTILQGAVSLPRKRGEFRSAARRRGSYHDAETEASTELVIKADTKDDTSKFCTLPRQRKSQSYSIKNVSFEKGPGKKSLGFTVVGGKDSPKGSIGIYVKSIFPSGQAVGSLREGDEIFSVNGRSVAGLTHSEAIGMFKETKVGSIAVTLGRREARRAPGEPIEF